VLHHVTSVYFCENLKVSKLSINSINYVTLFSDIFNIPKNLEAFVCFLFMFLCGLALSRELVVVL